VVSVYCKVTVYIATDFLTVWLCTVKSGFGQLVGVAALVIMGILEIVRKADMAVHGGFSQNVGGTVYNASYISIFWQSPQFVLAGFAEAFTAVSGE
jgi:hypothetical protein